MSPSSIQPPEEMLIRWAGVECRCDAEVGYLCESCHDTQVVRDLVKERDRLRQVLQRIALLADIGSDEHRAEFGVACGANGWRVAERMREIANDVVGSLLLRNRFKRFDRVRVKFGVDRGHYGTVVSVGGDDGTYYGVKLDCHDAEMGYSEYELGAA